MQPEAAALRLRAALERLGLRPSAAPEQQALTDALLRYLALLAKWNRTYNLTAVRDPAQMLVQHVFDSAAAVPPLRRLVEAGSGKWRSARPQVVDVGSGGGLPGIVLAILWPDAEVTLVEPVAKKAAFLQQAAAELALTNVRVQRARIEDLAGALATPEAIVCRAFASLADYARAVSEVAGPHTVVAAMKAAPDEDEKSALTDGWRIAEEIPLQVPELEARRSLVVLARTAARRAAVEQESQSRD